MADLFHYRSLTGAINKIQAAPQFLLNKLFTNRVQVFSEDIDVDIVVGGKSLAPFVSPIEEGTVLTKLGREMQTVKAPRIRVKKNLNAQELLVDRAVGANLYVADGGGVDTWKKQKIGQELQDIKSRILRTKEWMAAQALQGKLTVSQENIEFEIDFNFPTAHKPALSGTERWSDTANAKPHDDLLEWKRLISAATGFTGNLAICGKNVPGYLLNNAKVRTLLDTRNLSIGQLAFENGNYIGRLVGVDIFSYDATYTDASGTTQSFIPDDAVILVAPAGPFRLYHALIYDLDNNAAIASEFFSKSWTDKDPSLMWMLAESRPLPVPHWPECVVYATVHQ